MPKITFHDGVTSASSDIWNLHALIGLTGSQRPPAVGFQCRASEIGSVLLHSRQWVGLIFTGRNVVALTQPPRTRRQGKTTACGPSASMTATSRSRLNGALSILSQFIRPNAI